jgi:hypothetical protein
MTVPAVLTSLRLGAVALIVIVIVIPVLRAEAG